MSIHDQGESSSSITIYNLNHDLKKKTRGIMLQFEKSVSLNQGSQGAISEHVGIVDVNVCFYNNQKSRMLTIFPSKNMNMLISF